MEGKVRAGDSSNDTSGIGIDNVISRLELFFGRKNLLQIESGGPGQGTEVRISIPCGAAAEKNAGQQ